MKSSGLHDMRSVLARATVNSAAVALFSLQTALSLLLDIPCLTWPLSLAVPSVFVSVFVLSQNEGVWPARSDPNE